jgi:hypothetical protein
MRSAKSGKSDTRDFSKFGGVASFFSFRLSHGSTMFPITITLPPQVVICVLDVVVMDLQVPNLCQSVQFSSVVQFSGSASPKFSTPN